MRYVKVRLSPVSADEPKRFYAMLPVYQPWKSLASFLEVHVYTLYADLHAFDIYGELLYTPWAKEKPPSR